jgi:hypothetical protein
MTDYQDVIAEFVDSEPVEAQALGDALARPEGRAYLIDLLVLRGLVGDARAIGGRPANATGSRTANVAGGPGARGLGARGLGAGGLQPAGTSKHATRWLSIAALLTMGVAGGFLAARLMFMRGEVNQINDARPPAETAMPASTVTAPAPTHVIRMEKGVDWNERSGGN